MQSIKITVELNDNQAWQLAQFIKRIGFSEIRQNAENDETAYTMRAALYEIQERLGHAGYNPR